MGCDGWGSRLTIDIANSPIIIEGFMRFGLNKVFAFQITHYHSYEVLELYARTRERCSQTRSVQTRALPARRNFGPARPVKVH